MKKTLLLCFIHGFKGGDDTFANFPSHLKAVLQHALPKVTVLATTYPKYETRGDLHECVGRFKEWLQNKVIDLEVANNTPSPTVEPSVRTILIGHSMGGIVAAETLLSIINDQQPIHSSSSSLSSEPGSLMFPYIQGILAFDTPFLGIAPGVVAHGAERHWQTASSAYSAYSNLAQAFGWGGSGNKSPGPAGKEARKMLTAPSAPGTAPPASANVVNDPTADVAAAPAWQRYGRVALFAGAAGAIAAGGAAAYMKRDTITEGWSWATSHLEFVGVLARPEEMKKRLSSVTKLSQTLDIGFENIYTALGHAVDAAASDDKKSWMSGGGKVPGIDRTFCNLPKGDMKAFFVPAINDKCSSETLAHMSMFEPRNNPGYYGMSERAKETIIKWAENRWYEESDGPAAEKGMGGMELDEEAEMVERDEVDVDEEGFEDVRGATPGLEEFEKVGGR